jgi:hypothetical protein
MTETVHMGRFGDARSRRFRCYHDDESDGYWYVGFEPLDDVEELILRDWCEEMIGVEDEDWGLDADEFYSYMSAGSMFWFKDATDRLLFRMAWSPI